MRSQHHVYEVGTHDDGTPILTVSHYDLKTTGIRRVATSSTAGGAYAQKDALQQINRTNRYASLSGLR